MRPRATRETGNVIGWVVGAVAVVVLIVVLVTRQSGPSAQAAGAPPGGPEGMATSDIASMTPRERADRLFNRVMQAASSGDSSEISFFAPMAVQSYGMLDTLDADARYHVGLLEAELGNFSGTLAQADTLARADAAHLFVPMLRAEATKRQGNQAQLTRFYRRFLDEYDGEIATNKQEYRDHTEALTAFRDTARAAIGVNR